MVGTQMLIGIVVGLIVAVMFAIAAFCWFSRF